MRMPTHQCDGAAVDGNRGATLPVVAACVSHLIAGVIVAFLAIGALALFA